MDIKTLKSLEEKAKAKGKKLLIENVQLNIKNEQIECIKETLTEAIDGNKYKARAIIRNVPVSRFTENLNGRVYPRELDEKIIKEKVAEGTLSLADHPEDDGSVTKICGVWHNFRLGEHQSYADWYLVGPIGELIKESLEAGSKGAGISRVGFGEFMEDGKTVNPESYELERLGDCVLNPSQQVYATYENLAEPKNDNPIVETITNKKKENQPLKEKVEKIENQENEDEVKNMKFEESILRNNLTEGIRKAKANPDIKEAIAFLKEAHVPEELSDIKVRIDTTIAELQEKLNSQKENAEAKVVELTTKNSEMEVELSSLNEKYKKAKAIIEKVGLDESINVDELKENVKKMAEELSNYELNEKEMMKDLKVIDKILEHKYAKKLEITKPAEFVELMEDTFKRDKDIAYLKEKIKSLKKDLIAAEKHIVLCEKELVKRGFKFTEEQSCEAGSPEAPVQEEEEDPMELPEEEDMIAGEEPVEEGFEGGEGDVEGDAGGEEDYEFSFDEEDEASIDADENQKVEEEDEDIMGVDGDGGEEIAEEDDMGGQAVTDDGQIVEDDEAGEEVPEIAEDDEVGEAGGEEVLPEEDDSIPEEGEFTEEGEEEIPSEPMGEEDEEGEEEVAPEPVQESVKPYRFNYNHNEQRIVRNSDIAPKAPQTKISKEALQERNLVKAFVAREVKKNAVARDIQKQLLASKTLKEAMGKLIRFENQKKQKKNESVKIKRFAEKREEEVPAWLRGRK